MIGIGSAIMLEQIAMARVVDRLDQLDRERPDRFFEFAHPVGGEGAHQRQAIFGMHRRIDVERRVERLFVQRHRRECRIGAARARAPACARASNSSSWSLMNQCPPLCGVHNMPRPISSPSFRQSVVRPAGLAEATIGEEIEVDDKRRIDMGGDIGSGCLVRDCRHLDSFACLRARCQAVAIICRGKSS